MEMREIAARSFRFHRAAYLSITQKCPLTCRHCFVESSPFRREAVTEDQIANWLADVPSSLEVLIISGGEPFANPRSLSRCLLECRSRGLYSVVATSGYWAPNHAAGRRFLDRFPAMDFLLFSTDKYHEEFLPLPQLRCAVDVARERGIAIGFQLVADDPATSPFVQRFFDQIDPEGEFEQSVFYVPLGAEGRAKQEAVPPSALGAEAVERLPEGPCEWLGTPWIHEDGAVCACPNLDVHRRADHPLNLGNINRDSFSQISADADASLYVQALRTLGPRGIADTLPVSEMGCVLDSFAGTSICDLCHALAEAPQFADKLETCLRERNLESRITALRLAAHGEVHPHV